ncbi:uncharacterized protein GIQ15_00544 [Arthroderma uncinatum]|uniref:uncharacterized protein n=1 Tax=Arthroderma uncinatum TaxID=74035 RepID=UPI00144A778A|nr:uncharacterized protein GIQ15_00544 [Arthroderma uncinatum]KAF3491027.1 hypothetical protein GIQ15_00544 [Arthroderma uncinatum]
MAQAGTELFATSWTLHRLSPLYHGQDSAKPLLDAPECIRQYADRLRDTLTGNVLGGIVQSAVPSTSATALDDVLSKAGALQECKWTNIPTWSYWNEEHSILEDPDQESPLVLTSDQSAGILITLQYENTNYKAVLLAGPDGYRHEDVRGAEGTTFLPLLVTRMPNALRQALISFLSETFDTRVSLLRLPSSFLCSALEKYLATLNRGSIRANRRAGQTSTSTVESRAFIESVVKEVQLTLSFPPPVSTDLKLLDVHLPRESLSAFYAHGLGALETDNDNNNDSGEIGVPTAPFLTAFSKYFDHNLAMKLDMTDFAGKSTTSTGSSTKGKLIRLTKVSCGAFVLGSEGRIKLLANPGRAILLDDSDIEGEGDGIDIDERHKGLVWRANEDLLRALIARAVGEGRMEVRV